MADVLIFFCLFVTSQAYEKKSLLDNQIHNEEYET